jgi:purine nucleosidase
LPSLIVDCDTGVDDAFAVLLAALTPGVELLALTTVWGNVPVEVGARNNLALLDLVGLDVSVALGAAGPSNGDVAEFSGIVHGEDGQGGHARPPRPDQELDERDAAQLIIDLARLRPGEIDLVAVGPLTNVAAALERDPELPGRLRSVTVMGGAADAPGNRTPAAEANIWHDPEAAAAVFAAGWPLTLVPLDVTMRVLLTDAHRAQLAAGGQVGRYLSAISDFYFDFNAQRNFDARCSPVHDAVAVAIAIGALEVTRAPHVSVEIDTTRGPGRGQTICDTRQRYRGFARPTGPVRLVLDVAPGFPDALTTTLAV